MRRAFFFLLGGCASLTGLDELTADLPEGVDAPDRPLADGGTVGSDSSSGGSGSDADGATTNPAVDGSASHSDSSTPSTRIRNITFEDNALVHPTSGFDSTVGSAQLLSQSPIGGAYSMLVDGVGAFGTVSFAAVADLYVTVRLRIDPAGSQTSGDARFLRVTHGGAGAAIEAFVRASPRDLVVAQGSTTLATFPNLASDGTVYRFELRMRSIGSVTARLIVGGSTSSIGAGASVGPSTKVEIGALAGGTVRATFDDIGLDSAVQP